MHVTNFQTASQFSRLKKVFLLLIHACNKVCLTSPNLLHPSHNACLTIIEMDPSREKKNKLSFAVR